MSSAAELFLATKSFCTVKDNYQMAFVDMNDNSAAKGDTFVFLHGNPTSSYLWRNIMEPLNGQGRRLIAPDLMGMGDSDKLMDSSDEAYNFKSQIEYLDAFMENCVGLTEDEKLILVIHDWGSGLGFNWAHNNPDKVKGIAYMEAVVRGFDSADFSEEFLTFFNTAKTPGVGEQLWLEGETNASVEGLISRYPNLTEDDKSVYRAPYLTPGEDRRVTLALPRDVPFDGEPAESFAIIEKYSKWLTKTNIPKLLVAAEPGLLMVGPYLSYARTFPNQEEVIVTGEHYVQEDSPVEIAKAIEDWVGAMVEEDVSSEAKEVSVEDDAISSAHNNVASMLKLFVVSALAVVYFF
jgi:haloalkane dehalogenase